MDAADVRPCTLEPTRPMPSPKQLRECERLRNGILGLGWHEGRESSKVV